MQRAGHVVALEQIAQAVLQINYFQTMLVFVLRTTSNKFQEYADYVMRHVLNAQQLDLVYVENQIHQQMEEHDVVVQVEQPMKMELVSVQITRFVVKVVRMTRF